MEGYFSDRMNELCRRVREASRDLPEPVRASKEAFFDIDNLWKIEIRTTCDQAVEYIQGVSLLIDEGLNRPAAALSRSIHECGIRFHYLAGNEGELPDWFLWQMSHDYHATLETIRYYDALGAKYVERSRRLQQEIRDVADFLGREPDKPDLFWKSMRTMLRDLTSDLGPEAAGPIYFQLISEPSDYVHIHVTGQPNGFRTLQMTEITFAAIIKKAMHLCNEKQLLGQSATEIGTLCDEILQ